MSATDDIKKNIDSAKAVYTEGSNTRKKWLIFGAGLVVMLVVLGLFRIMR